jgi:hypothetical protein
MNVTHGDLVTERTPLVREKLEVIIGSSERLQLNRGVSCDACTLLNK